MGARSQDLQAPELYKEEKWRVHVYALAHCVLATQTPNPILSDIPYPPLSRLPVSIVIQEHLRLDNLRLDNASLIFRGNCVSVFLFKV